MSYTDKKITQAEINAHHVQGATDYLIGNAQQNKAVFDDLPEFIAGKFNDLIDEIAGQHGDEIKVAVDEWLAEHPEATTTVQDDSLTTAKYKDGSVTPAKLDRTYTTPSDLSGVSADLENEINVLDARMDTFASLPDGSTAGEAELTDIRVGADGITYPSAGAAVRGQDTVLKNALTIVQTDEKAAQDTLYGKHYEYIDYQVGRYYSTGYAPGYKSYINGKQHLSGGRYVFPALDDYDYAVTQYISDSSGVIVIAFRDASLTYEIPDNCIVCVRKINGNGTDFTAAEIEYIKQNFRIEKVTANGGIADELERTADTVESLNALVVGEDNPLIDIAPTMGFYLQNGFGGASNYVRWRTSNALPPGTYEIINTDPEFVYYWTDYVSDTQGNVIISSRSDGITWSSENSFYLTFAKETLDNITAEDVTSRFTVRKLETSNAIEARVNRLYSSQNVVFMGDSIFGMERSQTSIPSLCGAYTGANTHNCAIGGTAVLEHPNDYKYFDFGNLTDAIISGDFSNQIAHQSDSGNPSYIPSVITELQSLDFAKVNIITISYGTNDWAMALGTNEQILDGIIANINKMLEAFPNLRFLVMAPPYRFWLNQGVFVDDSDTRLNSKGVTLKSLVDSYSQIKESCHVPIVTPYYEVGINRYNRSQWFLDGDGTHPGEQGRKETAKLVSEYLRRMLYD